MFFFFLFSINSIKALIRKTIMEMAVQEVVVVAAILMNHTDESFGYYDSNDVGRKCFFKRRK